MLVLLKRLIAINHIQNKSFYVQNVCVRVCVYYVYINTHTFMYVFKKIGYVHILNIFRYNINYIYKYIFSKYILYVCLYIYIYIYIYNTHTYIMYTKTFILDAINRD